MTFVFKIVVLYCLAGIGLNAQSNLKTLAGIYTSYEDFKKGKLSYQVDCLKEKQKIRLYDFMQKPYLDVIYKGQKIRLWKGDLFGYQDCEGNVSRFYCNKEYTLAEIRMISIYFMEEEISLGYSLVNNRLFYFSPTPDGMLLPLTVENLKKTYPGNSKFHTLLDREIKHDSELSSYNEAQCIFKVNTLYNLSLL